MSRTSAVETSIHAVSPVLSMSVRLPLWKFREKGARKTGKHNSRPGHWDVTGKLATGYGRETRARGAVVSAPLAARVTTRYSSARESGSKRRRRHLSQSA